jgi:hypothetical protein
MSLDKDKQVENQTDHICISQNWNKSLLDVRNKGGADTGSDHHMIMGILRIKVQKVTRKTTIRKKYNLRKLEDRECQRTFKGKLRKGASSIRYKVPEGVEAKWERIKTAFQGICEHTLGHETNTKKSGYLTAHGR